MLSWAVARARSFPPATWWSYFAAAPNLVIATVLVPGATRAETGSSAKTVKAMKPGSVIVDVAIDQGGCAETSRPTTHSHPTYLVDDVVHYCVAEYAWRRTTHFDLCLEQRHHFLHPHIGRHGLAAGARRGSPFAKTG